MHDLLAPVNTPNFLLDACQAEAGPERLLSCFKAHVNISRIPCARAELHTLITLHGDARQANGGQIEPGGSIDCGKYLLC